MPDLSLSVTVTRTDLGLSDLDINDHTNYYVAEQFLGGTQSWNRTQISSPWVDGSVTVQRYREMVQEQVAIEVLGDNPAQVQSNMKTLIDAFMQDQFVLTVVTGGETNAYLCESADFQLTWTGPRVIANQQQVIFTVPRQPITQAGI